MDIWVTTTHAIPNNGVIELTFVGVNVKDPYWKFDETQANGTATVD
jgi:hypothetical protein